MDGSGLDEGQDPSPRVGASVGVLVVRSVEERVASALVRHQLVRDAGFSENLAEALDVFLAAVRNGTEEDKARGREAMLKLFAVLGDDDPLTAEYRRRLASVLF